VAVLGLILIAAAGVLTAAVVTSNTGAVETDLWGMTVSSVSIGVVFVAGMLAALVGGAGLLLLTGGLRRGRRLRQERRVLRRENERLSQQVGSGPSTGDGTAGGVWRRPTEPVGSRAAGGARGSDDDSRGATDRPVETTAPLTETSGPVEGADRTARSARARATSDSGS
jgi:hypothetical protein